MNLLEKVRFLVYASSIALIFLFNTKGYASETVRVAVASNFYVPLKNLKKEYETLSNDDLILINGSTAKLYAQIMNGAPVDIFLSADKQTANRLIQNGKADKRSLFNYATGKLVLWANRPGYNNPSQLKDALYSMKFTRLAIANPKLAPYGRAAMDVIKSLPYEIGGRLVYGENVGQTFQFVYTGNVELGLIALSQIKMLKHNQIYWEIPTNLYRSLDQAAVLLNRANENTAARDFIEFLKSAETQRTISEEYGYLSRVAN